MPINKERLAAVIDETFLLCERYRLIIADIEGHVSNPDPALGCGLARVYIQQLRDRGHMPEPRIAYAERMTLRRTWDANEYRKGRRAAERLEARAAKQAKEEGYNYAGHGIKDPSVFDKAANLLKIAEGAAPLTNDQWKRISKPDDASALPLPEGVEVVDMSDPQSMHEAIAKAVGETEKPGPK